MRQFIRNIFSSENIMNIGKDLIELYASDSSIRRIVASTINEMLNNYIGSNRSINSFEFEKKMKLAQDVIECVALGLKILNDFYKTGSVLDSEVKVIQAWAKGEKTPEAYKK